MKKISVVDVAVAVAFGVALTVAHRYRSLGVAYKQAYEEQRELYVSLVKETNKRHLRVK